MKRKLFIFCLTAICVGVPSTAIAQAPRDLENALTVGIAALHGNATGKRAALAAPDSVVPRDNMARAARRLGYLHHIPGSKGSRVDVLYEVYKRTNAAGEITFYLDAVYTEGTQVHVTGKSVSLVRRGNTWVVTRQRNLYVT